MSLPKFEDLCSIDTWNRRYHQLKELVHEGPEARSLVIQVLEYLKTRKDLSFGERKMLDLAQNYDLRMKEFNEKVKDLNEFRNKKNATA